MYSNLKRGFPFSSGIEGGRAKAKARLVNNAVNASASMATKEEQCWQYREQLPMGYSFTDILRCETKHLTVHGGGLNHEKYIEQ